MSSGAERKVAPASAQVTHEDRSRMQRLYEEVQSRLQEMASIGTRVMVEKDAAFAKALKQENGKGTLKFEPVSKGALKGALEMKGVEIICYGCGCVVYDYDQNICYVA